MKIISLLILLLSFDVYAKDYIGFYEVPREDGEIVNFTSKVDYKGKKLSESEEFTVHFPETLDGERNQFTITKTGPNEWSGDPELFESVVCETGIVFDFACEIVFNKAAVVVIEETNFDEPMDESNKENKLFINRSLAEEKLMKTLASPALVSHHLISTDSLINEPIGFFKYREDY